MTARQYVGWNENFISQGCAIRGRYNEDRTISQRLELNGTEKSNTLTTVQKDSLIYQLPHGVNKGGLKAVNGKTPAMTSSQWQYNNILVQERVRKLTPIECERLQTVPDNYTSSVSDSQRYKMLGNGWTIDVIAHIFQGLDKA